MCHRAHEGHGRQCQPQAATCCCGSHSWRRFQSREEKVAQLNKYLEDLEKETKAVQEQIAALKGG